MKRIAIAVLLLVLLGFSLSCVPSYRVKVIEQVETNNVTPITLEEAARAQGHEATVTFVVRDNGISADSVVYIGKFHKGAEADALYIIRNETDTPIAPLIFFTKDTRIADYSAVDGQGYEDAPTFVEEWIQIVPESTVIPAGMAQGYIVALVMPDEEIEGLPKNFAFQVGVAVGGRVQLAVSPWWLVSRRD